MSFGLIVPFLILFDVTAFVCSFAVVTDPLGIEAAAYAVPVPSATTRARYATALRRRCVTSMVHLSSGRPRPRRPPLFWMDGAEDRWVGSVLVAAAQPLGLP